MEAERDLCWDVMYEWAERVQRSGRAGELSVRPSRRRVWRRLAVVEGLWAGDLWTDVFEPVRVRRFGSTAWREIQPVPAAASSIGAFLDRRPDLADDRR